MNRALVLAALVGCYTGLYPVTPTVATPATYKIYAGGAQGTAWAVDKHHLVTAGHVCDLKADNYVLTGDFGRSFNAHSILWEMSDDDTHDLCVLETDATLNHTLIIADRMPLLHEKVSFVGYPLGQFVVSHGEYLGDTDGPNQHLNDYVFTAPCDHGASGSAVFTDRGVWGVLVRVRTEGGEIHDGEEGCVASPLAHIKRLLDDAGVHYDTTPQIPPPVPGGDNRGLPVEPAPMLGSD